MQKLSYSHLHSLVLTGAALIAAPSAHAGGFLGDIGRGLGNAIGAPELVKLADEGDNAMRDIKQHAPVVAAVTTIVAVPVVGTLIAAKEQPKEAAALLLLAGSAAVACADGCTMAITGLTMLGGTAVAVPLVTSNGPTQPQYRAPSPSTSQPNGSASAPSTPPGATLDSTGAGEKLQLGANHKQPVKAGPRVTAKSSFASRPSSSAEHRFEGGKQKPSPTPAPAERGLVWLPSSYSTKPEAKHGPLLTGYGLPPEEPFGIFWSNASYPAATSDANRKMVDSFNPTLGEPWLEFKPQASASGAASKWAGMLKWNVREGPVSRADFSVNPPITLIPRFVYLEPTISEYKLKGVSVVFQEPLGLVAPLSIGTMFIGEPNVVLETRVLSTSGGVVIKPGKGYYNAAGQLESAVYKVYGFCLEPSRCWSSLGN